MDFDYFYNREAEQFNFLKVPEILVDGEEFKGLSAEAIILYSMLLKRTGTKTIKKIGKVSISAAGLALPPSISRSFGKSPCTMSWRAKSVAVKNDGS